MCIALDEEGVDYHTADIGVLIVLIDLRQRGAAAAGNTKILDRFHPQLGIGIAERDLLLQLGIAGDDRRVQDLAFHIGIGGFVVKISQLLLATANSHGLNGCMNHFRVLFVCRKP